jgi:hypothetical protein
VDRDKNKDGFAAVILTVEEEIVPQQYNCSGAKLK